MVDWLLGRMAQAADQMALAHGSELTCYRDLLDRIAHWQSLLAQAGIAGRVISIEGDYGVESIAAFIAAMQARNILVPIASASRPHLDEFLDVAEVEHRVIIGHPGDATSVAPAEPRIIATGCTASHEYFQRLRRAGSAGLVLFSSGSTGKHKAAVHDLAPLLQKFSVPRHCYRTLVFLQLDHIGGINTLFYTLANGGAVVVPEDRMPSTICAAIAQHRVELLPTSPTFLNLLLLSEEHLRHDLSSLQLITYGTEPMPQSTLQRTHAAFPDVRLLQTYGLSELGILRSQSRESGSLWVRVGGEGYETKIVDGRLWVRAQSAMLGYLNASSPFDADGFFDTGDLVEQDGEWIRILGRKSEIINVGGNKVFPTEVENALLGLDNVEDVVVRGEPNPLTGQAVVAAFRLKHEEPAAQFKTRMRLYCQGRLAAYKIPVKVQFVETLHSERFKKIRQLA
jgi:long-chain acyl-CoA synthetase